MIDLASQSLWVISILFIGTGLVITVLVVLAFRRLFPDGVVPNADIKFFAVVGSGVNSLCGLLFALIVVNVWQNFNQQEERMALEAVELANLYRDAEGIDQNYGIRIKGLTTQYANNIITYGWPAMEKGGEGKQVWYTYNNLHAAVINYQPVNGKEELIHKRMVEHLNAMASFRRLRLMNSSMGNIPGILWSIVIIAGILSVCFTNFFRLDNKFTQAILTSVHAVIISMILMLVFMLNNPYKGPMKLSPYPFEHLVQQAFPDTDSIYYANSR